MSFVASISPVGTSPVSSAQTTEAGTPRFVLAGPTLESDWLQAVEAEGNGGVDPEHRTFLDAQLEMGDLVVDLAPGFGFLALGVVTHSAGASAAVVLPTREDAEYIRLSLAVAADTLQDAGATDRLHICTAPDGLTADVIAHIADLIEGSSGRIFARMAPDQCLRFTQTFAPALRADRLVAVLLDAPPTDEGSWQTALSTLRSAGFAPHALAEQDGELGLFAVDAPPAGTPLVALHQLALEDSAPEVGEPESSLAPPAPWAAVAPVAPRHASAVETLNFIAPAQRTGYGVVGSNLLRALLEEGAAISYFPIGAVDRSMVDGPTLDAVLDAQALFDAAAPSVRLAQQFDLAMHVGRGPRIGFPIFECTRFTTRARHHLKQQDALLVCTEWARGVLLANGLAHIPAHVVPLGVDRHVFHEGVTPGARAHADETVFLHVGKLEDRKGQLELLRAFEAAFTPRDAVRLELLCHNPFLGAEALTNALAPFRRSPMAARITLRTEPLPTQADVAARMAAADCGVSCARAEGWNLEALEMLSVGKPFIATAYSGHTGFLDAQNAHLVTVDALEPHETYGDWAAWGASQQEQLVTHLRSVHRARQSGALAVNEAGIETAERHTWRHTARALLRALQ